MKTIISSFLLFFAIAFSVSGQFLYLSLSGQVFDEATGAPIPNHVVNANVMSGGMVLTYTYTTSSNGYYGDSIPILGSGSIDVSTLDCNGELHSQSGTFSPNGSYFIFDFYICADSSATGCQASFGYQILDNQTVAFYDLSIIYPGGGSPDYWQWEFGDGTTSSEQNPVHNYNATGNFPVCLTIMDNAGTCQSTWCDVVNIGGSGNNCENWFTYNTINNYDFTFNGQSAPLPADYYFWDFGDGNTSVGQEVTHTYNPSGSAIYMVTLSTFSYDPATGDSCVAYSSQEVWVYGSGNGCTNWFSYETPNNIDFTFYGESNPQANLYHWDFGDGTYGEGQNVTHSYGPNIGDYVMIILTTFANDSVSGDSCTATSVQEIWLNGSGSGCENWFWYDQNGIGSFNFHGESFPFPATGYFWDFGDGQTGYGQTVSHAYEPNTGDVFLVTLTTYAYDPAGDSCTAVSMQEVWLNGSGNGCENWFWYVNPSPDVFEFQGESYPVPAAEYIWDFGDGTTGYGPNVAHTFVPGTNEFFIVTLTTLIFDPSVNDSCVAVSSQEVWVGNQPGDCQNFFWYESLSTFDYTFHGESFPLPAEQYMWQFDNGMVLFGQEVSYTFDPSWGNAHFVCLTTFSYSPAGDSCTYTSCQEIILGGQTGTELFGTIFTADSVPADYALVGLFGMKPDGSFSYDFTIAEFGMYFFENVQAGEYYIFASLTPQSQFFYDYFPTYYGDAVTWSTATLITLGEPQNPYIISLVPMGNIVSGSGIINGSVTMGEEKGDPGTNITIMLMDEEENILAFTESDEEGLFSFENLAFDTYKLTVEIPGKPSAIATVALHENNPEGDVTFIVKDAEVTLTLSDLPAFASFVGEIFPNPIADAARIEITLTQPADLYIKIVNQLGQEVQSEMVKLAEGNQMINIETSGLKNGFYTLQITDGDGGMLVKKFIK